MPVGKRGALLEPYAQKQPVCTSQAPLLTPIPATRIGFSDFIDPAGWIDLGNRSLKQRTDFPFGVMINRFVSVTATWHQLCLW
jgi:hypothetical protein